MFYYIYFKPDLRLKFKRDLGRKSGLNTSVHSMKSKNSFAESFSSSQLSQTQELEKTLVNPFSSPPVVDSKAATPRRGSTSSAHSQPGKIESQPKASQTSKTEAAAKKQQLNAPERLVKETEELSGKIQQLKNNLIGGKDAAMEQYDELERQVGKLRQDYSDLKRKREFEDVSPHIEERLRYFFAQNQNNLQNDLNELADRIW